MFHKAYTKVLPFFLVFRFFIYGLFFKVFCSALRICVHCASLYVVETGLVVQLNRTNRIWKMCTVRPYPFSRLKRHSSADPKTSNISITQQLGLIDVVQPLKAGVE